MCYVRANAISVKTGFDLAQQSERRFCEVLAGLGKAPVPVPEEVVQCSAYRSVNIFEGRGVAEMLNNALLLDFDGKTLRASKANQPPEQYFGGRRYVPIRKRAHPRRKPKAKAASKRSRS